MKIREDIALPIPEYDLALRYVVTVYDVDSFLRSEFATPDAVRILSNRQRILFYRPHSRGTSTISRCGIGEKRHGYDNFIHITFK